MSDLSIGIDIGGTKVLGGVVDGDGTILATSRRDTPKEGGRLLTETIADVANELLAAHSGESDSSSLLASLQLALLAQTGNEFWRHLISRAGAESISRKSSLN